MMSLQIISNARAPLPLDAFIFALGEHDLFEERPVQELVDMDTVQRWERWALRLSERTRGLLVKQSTEFGSHMAFLHATAKDFLLTPHRHAEMQLATAKRGFDVNVALLRAFIYQIQTLKSTTPDWEEWRKTIGSKSATVAAVIIPIGKTVNLIDRAIHYARQAGQSTGQAQTMLLDNLDRVAGGVILPPSTGLDNFQPSSTSAYWTAAILHNLDGFGCDYCPTSFLEFAIMNGLTLYVATKLHQAKLQGTPLQPSLLLAATLAMVRHKQNIPQNYPQV
ncbi:MAG: hypothetical protein Q9221_007777 [Calogaya cf. arnoldii]